MFHGSENQSISLSVVKFYFSINLTYYGKPYLFFSGKQMIIVLASGTIAYVLNLFPFPLSPGACFIKLITAVIYGFHNKLECLSLTSVSSLV
jgi:hypothetical protein